MIERVTGNLLEADVEALVNTVNTVGIMGKGLALQFRQAFPANYQAYRQACARHEVRPGQMFIFDTGQLTNPRYIINFPTEHIRIAWKQLLTEGWFSSTGSLGRDGSTHDGHLGTSF